ncbi:DUF6625 family protein [Caenispirillum salinarum]|uniref:DUF6625 family protein n=1 Tax=Caenispirillum salinarum TaxID=859058 RepID=UPI00384BBF8C
MSSHKIALLTVWCGPLPPYLDLFLLTAGRNEGIDFKIISDQPPPRLPAPNIEWTTRSRAGLVRQMSQDLDCPLGVDHGYKLVDLKPAFGHAFADLLKNYDFWGHIDCDTILGDLAQFLTPERLDNHDILIFRGRNFVHGPLTVYSNRERINALYRAAPGWRDTFSDPRPLEFDETCGRGRVDQDPCAPEIRVARGERTSMSDVVFTAASRGLVRLYDQDHVMEINPRALPVKMRWRNGRLFDESPIYQQYRDLALHIVPQRAPREVLFYHLLFAKQIKSYRIPRWASLPDEFFITNLGVYPSSRAPVWDRWRDLAARGAAVALRQRAR